MAVSKQDQDGLNCGHDCDAAIPRKRVSLSTFIPYLLIAGIAYFGYACGRAYGWTGALVFLGALLVLSVVIVLNGDGQTVPGSGLALVCIAYVLAAIAGVTGVAKRRAALQCAGSKPPKSG